MPKTFSAVNARGKDNAKFMARCAIVERTEIERDDGKMGHIPFWSEIFETRRTQVQQEQRSMDYN